MKKVIISPLCELSPQVRRRRHSGSIFQCSESGGNMDALQTFGTYRLPVSDSVPEKPSLTTNCWICLVPTWFLHFLKKQVWHLPLQNLLSLCKLYVDAVAFYDALSVFYVVDSMFSWLLGCSMLF